MKLGRRDVLSAAAVGAMSLALPQRARADARPLAKRPKAFVQLYIYGGMDAIYTTNPRIRSEVDPRVEVPFEELAITTVGGKRIGPLLRPIGKHLESMAILNGVYCATVAHETGEIQTQQMRRSFPAATGVGLAGTIGRTIGRDMPLDDVRFLWSEQPRLWVPPGGRSLVLPYYLDSGDAGILARLNRLVRDGGSRAAVVKAAEKELARCTGADDCNALRVASALLERMPSAPFPARESRPLPNDPKYLPPPVRQAMWDRWAGMCRDAAYLLSQRLTASIFVQVPTLSFDGHTANADCQNAAMGFFVPAFNAFMDELAKTKTPEGGVLADEVGVIVSSELGRFPVLNHLNGKDHFPEFPAMLFGPGLRPGQYGETDKLLSSVPISYATGHAGGSAPHQIPSIDDLGSTILKWFGIEDARSRGYLGRPLDCLLA